MLMNACFILLKAIWIQGGSSARKGKEAWICRQPKWSILCTSSTKTSTSHVHNSWRNASGWKGDRNTPFDFVLVRHLMFLLAKNAFHLFSYSYFSLEWWLQRTVIVPPEKGYGKKGMNEIPVKICSCHLMSFNIDSNLTSLNSAFHCWSWCPHLANLLKHTLRTSALSVVMKVVLPLCYAHLHYFICTFHFLLIVD